MTILATSKTKTVPGPNIRVNCPTCGPNVPAQTYRTEERMGVYFIPLFTQRETFVKCVKCGEARLTRLPLEKLGGYPPNELDYQLYHRVSLVIKFLALASVLLFFVPYLSLGLGAIGFAATYRTGGWVKVVSLVGLVLGALVSVLVTVAILTHK